MPRGRSKLTGTQPAGTMNQGGIGTTPNQPRRRNQRRRRTPRGAQTNTAGIAALTATSRKMSVDDALNAGIQIGQQSMRLLYGLPHKGGR